MCPNFEMLPLVLALLRYQAEVCCRIDWEGHLPYTKMYSLSLRWPVCAGEAQHKDCG